MQGARKSQPVDTRPPAGGAGAAAALTRFPALLLAWGALGEGQAFWPWGVGAALAVTLASFRLLAPQRGRLAASARLLRLAPLFLRESLLGGWDVARRALSPKPVLRPRLELVRLERPDTATATALAYLITLMPGTLAVEVHRRRLLVHVIDYQRDNCRAIAALERRLARVLGEAE